MDWQDGRLHLYLSSYELWPLWQRRIWKEVATSSVDVWILKLHGLKMENKWIANVNLLFGITLIQKFICEKMLWRDSKLFPSPCTLSNNRPALQHDTYFIIIIMLNLSGSWLVRVYSCTLTALLKSFPPIVAGKGITTRAVTIQDIEAEIATLRSANLSRAVRMQNRDTTSSSALWAVSNTTLTLQRSFDNSPPLFVHTERNAAVKTNRCVIHTERDMMVHVMMMTCVFSRGFPRCLPC